VSNGNLLSGDFARLCPPSNVDNVIMAATDVAFMNWRTTPGNYVHALLIAVWPWGTASLKVGSYLATLTDGDVAWIQQKIAQLLRPGDVIYGFIPVTFRNR
jgi:hypothetical protein